MVEMGSSGRTITGRQVGFIMALSALTMPFMITVSGGYGTSGATVRGYAIGAMTWAIGLYSDGPVFHVMDIAGAIIGFPLLVYALFVQRYCSGKSSWKTPVFLGVIVNVVYVLFFSPAMAAYYQYGLLVYIGPLPITFILGLALMEIVGAPMRSIPFEGEFGSSGWWKSREPFSYSVGSPSLTSYF